MDIHKKSNKENTRPKPGQEKVITSFIKRTAPGKTVPLQSKNDHKDATVQKRAEPTKKAEQRAPRVAATVAAKPAAEASKKPQTLTQTFLSQQSASYKKLLTQGPKPAPTAAPPKSLLGTYKGKVIQSKVDCFRKPGETTAAAAADRKVFAKPAVPKTVGQTPATLSRFKSKSVTTLLVKPAPGVSQTQPRRPKSVTDVPLSRPAGKTNRNGQTQTVATVRQFQVTKRPPTARSVPPATATTRPAAGPKARPAPATAKKANENASRPPVVPTSQRPSRKPVTSTLSHTRAAMETVEERRAKLAEWLASKGKTLKRPPIHNNSAQPTQRPRPFVVPKADLQQNQEPAESHAAAAGSSPVPEAAEAEPKPVLEPEPEAVAELKTVVAEAEEEEEEEEGAVTSSPAAVMNTTLDMVDNCELDLPEVDVCMEHLVVNLCEALEAMETPSTCQSVGTVAIEAPSMCQSDDAVVMEMSSTRQSAEQHAGEKDTVAEQEAVGMEVQVGEQNEEDEEEQIEEEQDEVENAKDEIKEAFANKETDDATSTEESESSGEDSALEMEADSIEGSESGSDTSEDAQVEPAVADRKVKAEVKAEDEDDEDEEAENCATKTPECNGASVVKFSVRTTPYLQSVKKRIDGESSSSAVAAPSSCGSSRRQRQRQSGAAAIGDLKFLTPVRRSCRIQRQSARLPAALTEHDPCVTSLAELARLEGGGDEAHVGTPMAANAYIYRRNPALLDELPDVHRDLTRL
ncbi:cytoskeleton-associated protein 2 [Sardina pilchardus]|uniref:cytoskeleton-associated protein 2 n=1 Tax=Sardina pilchardus TaxID=27697 RepID=UPI002E12823D